MWFCCTTLFEIIEHRSGICSVTKYLSKGSCAAKGFRWRGFDISGTFEKENLMNKMRATFDLVKNVSFVC